MPVESSLSAGGGTHRAGNGLPRVTGATSRSAGVGPDRSAARAAVAEGVRDTRRTGPAHSRGGRLPRLDRYGWVLAASLVAVTAGLVVLTAPQPRSTVLPLADRGGRNTVDATGAPRFAGVLPPPVDLSAAPPPTQPASQPARQSSAPGSPPAAGPVHRPAATPGACPTAGHVFGGRGFADSCPCVYPVDRARPWGTFEHRPDGCRITREATDASSSGEIRSHR